MTVFTNVTQRVMSEQNATTTSPDAVTTERAASAKVTTSGYKGGNQKNKGRLCIFSIMHSWFHFIGLVANFTDPCRYSDPTTGEPDKQDESSCY